MQMRAPDLRLTARAIPDGALLPRHIRRVVLGFVGSLVAGAAYLLIVRGPAILFDLAHMTAAMFCM